MIQAVICRLSVSRLRRRTLRLGLKCRGLAREPPRVPLQEIVRRADRTRGLALRPRSIRRQLPRLAIVGEIRREQRAKAVVQRGALDRRNRFDTTIEIARHPVRGPEVVLVRTAVLEIPDARVFEKASDDTD